MSLLTEPSTDAALAAPAAPAAPADPAAPVNGAPAAPPTAEAVRVAALAEYKDQEAVRKFLDENGTFDPHVLLKSHINLEQKFGRERLAVPTTPEEEREVYSKLGCPEAADKYTLPKVDLPAGIEPNAEKEKMLREFAHSQGWNQKQFENTYKTLLADTAAQAEAAAAAQAAAMAESQKALKTKWGAAYDQNLKAAKVAVLEFVSEEAKAKLEETGWGNDPTLIEMFHRIGVELMGETRLKGAGGDTGAMTPDQLTARIEEFRAEHHKALFSDSHAEHALRVAELERLYKMRTG